MTTVLHAARSCGVGGGVQLGLTVGSGVGAGVGGVGLGVGAPVPLPARQKSAPRLLRRPREHILQDPCPVYAYVEYLPCGHAWHLVFAVAH